MSVISWGSDNLIRFSHLTRAVCVCSHGITRGEKEVATFLIDLARTAMPLLNMEWADLKKEVNKVGEW